MPKVREVYDLKNPERLLGEYLNAPQRLRGRSYMVAVHRPLSARYVTLAEMPAAYEERFRTVEFRFGEKRSECGWDTTGILLTDAPLSDLMDLPAFRLPRPKPNLRDEYAEYCQHRHCPLDYETWREYRRYTY